MIRMGKTIIDRNSNCFIIAEIGNNHQGELEKAIKMIHVAAACGANAVKFQKRNNKKLYTKEMYNKSYDNENSFGNTYGEHREALEFGLDEYKELMKVAKKANVEFLATAFDFDSADFLEELGIKAFKIASGDLTSLTLLEYIAKKKKPMFISTGASILNEIKEAFDLVSSLNKQICLFHCIATYPSDYQQLNLNFIKTLLSEFPETIIGYSSHENGILGPILAYMLGATVVEAHFTLNHAWKGTDHKFSLEPQGLQKMIRDLRRIDIALGDGKKVILPEELPARTKMGKSLYYSKNVSKGTIVQKSHLIIKAPGGLLPTKYFYELIGKKIKRNVKSEAPVSVEDFDY